MTKCCHSTHSLDNTTDNQQSVALCPCGCGCPAPCLCGCITTGICHCHDNAGHHSEQKKASAIEWFFKKKTKQCTIESLAIAVLSVLIFFVNIEAVLKLFLAE